MKKFNQQRKIIYIKFLLFVIIYFYNFKLKIKNIYKNLDYLKIKNEFKKIDISNITFAIIRRKSCITCGLFSDYNVFLGCINYFIIKGILPIIDMQSFKNILNEFNESKSNGNPWEFFFYQSFNQHLEYIKKKAKKLFYFECSLTIFRPNSEIFENKILQNFWHNIAKIYMPIQKKILLEAEIIFKKLFKDSYNILGILMRGTDYIAKKPRRHPIPPTPSMVIKDIEEINLKYHYKWFFISTEDDLIREIFIKKFGTKIKYLILKKINYNYHYKNLLAYNNNAKGINYSKTYLLNMIILSKCLDILSAKTSGAIGVFILSNGFRYSKIYNLGVY
jgi:hypothetical protein